jgi:hypothetical protein
VTNSFDLILYGDRPVHVAQRTQQRVEQLVRDLGPEAVRSVLDGKQSMSDVLRGGAPVVLGDDLPVGSNDAVSGAGLGGAASGTASYALDSPSLGGTTTSASMASGSRLGSAAALGSARDLGGGSMLDPFPMGGGPLASGGTQDGGVGPPHSHGAACDEAGCHGHGDVPLGGDDPPGWVSAIRGRDVEQIDPAPPDPAAGPHQSRFDYISGQLALLYLALHYIALKFTVSRQPGVSRQVRNVV